LPPWLALIKGVEYTFKLPHLGKILKMRWRWKGLKTSQKENKVLVELQHHTNSDDKDEEMFREDIVPGPDNCVRKFFLCQS
jgi:hypothetical protein